MRTHTYHGPTSIPVALLAPVLTLSFALSAWGITADHTSCAAFANIPGSVVELVKTDYRIFYGHTSHGGQIVTGMSMLYDEDPSLAYNDGAGTLTLYEYSDDLGHNGDVSWVPITETYLGNATYDINVVVWSWCGGASDNTEAGIDIYLDAMNQLELAHPEVIFVYMTGHLDGTGDGGNLRARNNQIRAYCEANGKVLFDFADIESWDPDGVFYPDESDGCAWCAVWCSTHVCPTCGDCAHSHCFNCHQKGKAFWWLLGALRTGLSVGVDHAGSDGSTLALPVLAQNSPNPFNPHTEIRFTLARPMSVTLEVLDLTGRVVALLENGRRRAGDHVVVWDGSGEDGRRAASGTYFYRLRADGAAETRKMILLK